MVYFGKRDQRVLGSTDRIEGRLKKKRGVSAKKVSVGKLGAGFGI